MHTYIDALRPRIIRHTLEARIVVVGSQFAVQRDEMELIEDLERAARLRLANCCREQAATEELLARRNSGG